MTDPFSGPAATKVLTSVLLGFFVGLFGPTYGVHIAIVVAGLWGAFFALVSDERRSSLPALSMEEPKTRWYDFLLKLVWAYTPGHRNSWRIILQGGVVAGLTTQITANVLAKRLDLTVYDILLPLAFLIGLFSDDILPFVRKFLRKQADTDAQ